MLNISTLIKPVFQEVFEAVNLSENNLVVRARYTCDHVVSGSSVTTSFIMGHKVACVCRFMRLPLSAAGVIDTANSAVSSVACVRVSQSYY